MPWPPAGSTTGTDHRILAFFRQDGFVWRAAMGLLFYLTLFIVMCVFGWSSRGGAG
jgi:hypothetical protein